MPDVRRILDANLNRAREAMRVMEEAARFILNDAELAAQLKKLRHDLATITKPLPGVEFHRDTAGDVGTAITPRSELKRDSIAAVLVAAGKRLSEALRCIEEYGKLVNEDFAAAVKQLRYRGYDLETALHRRLGADAVRQWRVCVIVTEALCTHRNWFDVAKAALDGGADCLQLREKSLSDAELLDRAARLAELAARRAHIIINDRADIALLSGAAGVHLGQDDLPLPEVRKLAGRQLIIGVSTHNMTEARGAVAASGGGGADYCGVGAMFPTTTKQRKPSGPRYLQQFLIKYPHMPHLAIGGITPQNIAELAQAGAQGVAVSSIVCGAKDPAKIVRQLRRAFDQP